MDSGVNNPGLRPLQCTRRDHTQAMHELAEAFQRLLDEHRQLLIRTRTTKRARDAMTFGLADFLTSEYQDALDRYRNSLTGE